MKMIPHQHREQRSVPVVAVHDIDRLSETDRQRDNGVAEECEPLHLVIEAVFPIRVDSRTIEEFVARDEVNGRRVAREGSAEDAGLETPVRSRNVQRLEPLADALEFVDRRRSLSVERGYDDHLVPCTRERLRQCAGDIAEPAGLCERRDFR